MEEKSRQMSNTEIEDRIQLLSSREETLRKDYEKCITWRVRVCLHLLYMINSTFQH